MDSNPDSHSPAIDGNILPNKEGYIQRINGTLSALEEQNLVNDSRYAQLKLLKEKIAGWIACFSDIFFYFKKFQKLCV